MMKLKTSYIDSIYKPNKETSNNKFGDTNITTRLAKKFVLVGIILETIIMEAETNLVPKLNIVKGNYENDYRGNDEYYSNSY